MGGPRSTRNVSSGRLVSYAIALFMRPIYANGGIIGIGILEICRDQLRYRAIEQSCVPNGGSSFPSTRPSAQHTSPHPSE